MRRDAVDARVDAECQPIARSVDRVDQRIEFAALPRSYVQNGAENLAFQVGDMVEPDHRRRHEGADRGQLGERRPGDKAARGGRLLDIGCTVDLKGVETGRGEASSDYLGGWR